MVESRIAVKAGITLLGKELEIRRNIQITIEDGVIASIGLSSVEPSNYYNIVDCRSGIVMPPLINSHTHTGDIGFQEVGYDLDIDSLVGEPYGLKYIYLERYGLEISDYIEYFLELSLESGVGAVADFREGGLEGFRAGFEASKRVYGITYIPMYMPKPLRGPSQSYYSIDHISRDLLEIKNLYSVNRWIAISSPHYYTLEDLKAIDKIASRENFHIASHIAETRDTRSESDFEKIKDLENIRLAVHGYWLNVDELEYLRERNIYLAICPRSSMWFEGTIPDLKAIKESEIQFTVGTDNGAWVKPDLWRELEALATISRMQGNILEPLEIIKASTVVPGELFNIENYIEENVFARLICIRSRWIDLRYAKNIPIYIVKRSGIESIYFMVLGNRVIYKT